MDPRAHAGVNSTSEYSEMDFLPFFPYPTPGGEPVTNESHRLSVETPRISAVRPYRADAVACRLSRK